MEIFRTQEEIATSTCEVLKEGAWEPLAPLRAVGGMIITNLTDDEHDKILNIRDHADEQLRGYRAKLILPKEDQEKDDPEFVDLVFCPKKGQVIRHQRSYYLVKLVVQSTSYSVAVFAKRITYEKLIELSIC